MSLKDKYNEYKEEKDRRDYFRKRNDLYVDNGTMLKTFLIAIVVAAMISVGIYHITSNLGIRITYFYVLLGGLVGSVVKNTADVSSKQMAIIAAVATVLGIFLSNVLMVGYYFIQGLGVSGIFYSLYIGFVSMFSDLFSILFVGIGAYIAFITAR